MKQNQKQVFKMKALKISNNVKKRVTEAKAKQTGRSLKTESMSKLTTCCQRSGLQEHLLNPLIHPLQQVLFFGFRNLDPQAE